MFVLGDSVVTTPDDSLIGQVTNWVNTNKVMAGVLALVVVLVILWYVNPEFKAWAQGLMGN